LGPEDEISSSICWIGKNLDENSVHSKFIKLKAISEQDPYNPNLFMIESLKSEKCCLFIKTFSIEEALDQTKLNPTLFNAIILEYDVDDEDTFTKIKSITEDLRDNRKVFEEDLNILCLVKSANEFPQRKKYQIWQDEDHTTYEFLQQENSDCNDSILSICKYLEKVKLFGSEGEICAFNILALQNFTDTMKSKDRGANNIHQF
jgi:hypothetical protein